jgi:DNA-binding MarR family transcriptional regulator
MNMDYTGKVLPVAYSTTQEATPSHARAEVAPTERPSKATKSDKAKGKSKGRFAVLNAFVDFTMGELSKAEIIVWMILYRDTKDGIAQTAQTDIARRGKIDRRTVGRALRRLASRGLLKIVHQGGFRRGVSRYRVYGLTAHRQSCPLQKA